MNRHGRSGLVRSTSVVALIAVLAGCNASTATPSAAGIPSAAPTDVPVASTGSVASSPTPVVVPSPTPALTPVVPASPTPPPPAAFTTAIPPAEDIAWTSLDVKPIDATDPLVTLLSMARYHGGFIALGRPITNHDGTARTPVWTSPDGGTWTPLDPSVFGPSKAVLAVGQLGNGAIAITATADMTQCGEDVENCYDAAPPLQAWTSTDGATWTANPVPSSMTGTSDVDPIVAIGNGGVVVVSYDKTDASPSVTTSTDGSTWSPLAASPFGKGADVTRIGALGDGFVAIGDTGGETSKARAWSSADGTTWTARTLPYAAPKGIGTSAGTLYGATGGAIADGGEQAAPGNDVWWSSADGATWTLQKNYGPLGVWNGEGEGSGLISNGTVAADGERILALRRVGGTAAWQSTDGLHWQDVAIHGLAGTGKNDWPVFDLTVLPVGVVIGDGDGHEWFGTPEG